MRKYNQIIKALYTINKRTKYLRDLIRKIEDGEIRVPDEFEDELIWKYKYYKDEYYYIKGKVIDKLLQEKPNIITKREKHYFSEVKKEHSEYIEYLIADYIEIKVDKVIYGFHYNVWFDVIDDFENYKEIKDEISSNITLPAYKNVSYAVAILKDFLRGDKKWI